MGPRDCQWTFWSLYRLRLLPCILSFALLAIIRGVTAHPVRLFIHSRKINWTDVVIGQFASTFLIIHLCVKMAAVCFGPPPLPPNKKSNFGHRCRKHSFLSSTYRSFRDPAEENDIILNTFVAGDKKNAEYKEPRRLLSRSYSDGNLAKKEKTAPMTINKYIKVLSGSWKNLLNRKW